MDKSIRILNDSDVATLLRNRDSVLSEVIENAYKCHFKGDFANPHSSLLTFPERPLERIWALPAYIGGKSPAVGLKWIASFPSNVDLGLERASGVIVLNSLRTGRPTVLLDGGRISALRTAMSAVLAANLIRNRNEVLQIGLIGCGRINAEVLRLLALSECITEVRVFDIRKEQIKKFKKRLIGMDLSVCPKILAVSSPDEVLETSGLISIATTAIEPHLNCWRKIKAGSTVLHLSLRDLPTEAILQFDNIVDDVDHVFRAETSLHLAEKEIADRSFVRTTIGSILCGASSARKNEQAISVFSPFGLGILDISVAQYLFGIAIEENIGTTVDWF